MVRTWLIPLLVSVALHAGAGVALYALGLLPNPAPDLRLPDGQVVIRAPSRVPMPPRTRAAPAPPQAIAIRFVDALPAAPPAEPVPTPPTLAGLSQPAPIQPPDLPATTPLAPQLAPDLTLPLAMAAGEIGELLESSRASIEASLERLEDALAQHAALLMRAIEVVANSSEADVQPIIEEPPTPEPASEPQPMLADAESPRTAEPSSGESRGIETPPRPHPGNRAPEYPREARRRHWEGTVTLLLSIDASGAVREAHVQSSSAHGVLDHAALEAAREWRFAPATLHGSATTCDILLPVEFVLRDEP